MAFYLFFVRDGRRFGVEFIMERDGRISPYWGSPRRWTFSSLDYKLKKVLSEASILPSRSLQIKTPRITQGVLIFVRIIASS